MTKIKAIQQTTNTINSAVAIARDAAFKEYQKNNIPTLHTIAAIITLIQCYAESNKNLFKPNSREFSSVLLNKRISHDIFNNEKLKNFTDSEKRVFFNKVKAAKFIFKKHRQVINSLYNESESVLALCSEIEKIVIEYKSLTRILDETKKAKERENNTRSDYDKIKTTFATATKQIESALENGIKPTLLNLIRENVEYLTGILTRANAKQKLYYKTESKKAA